MTGIYLTSTLWEMLIGRIEGPLTLRLVLQPTMASFLAVRAGLKDARSAGRPICGKFSRIPAIAMPSCITDGKTFASSS